MELISIIVPVYNQERYLSRCVDSILKQTYSNLEIILVDDGSKDRSREICDEYQRIDSRVVVLHRENGGVSKARNAGIEAARGEYIGFVDSDDWISEDMYEVLYRNISRYQADVSDIDAVITKRVSEYQNPPEQVCVLEGTEILKDFFLSEKFSCGRKLYRREVIGDVRFPVELSQGEDMITNYRFLSNAKREVKSSLKCYYYYTNPNSLSVGSFKRKDLGLLEATERMVKLSKNVPEVHRLAQIKQTVTYYSMLGRYIAFDCEPGFEPREQVDECRKKLRENYGLLVRSHISLKRKLLISACMVCSPHLLRKIYRSKKG